jgi:hypothetical protein
MKKNLNLWKKLVKELNSLQDDNYTARVLYNYITKYYNKKSK